MSEKLRKTIEDIEKKFGRGTIMSFDETMDYSLKRVPSGSLFLDIILGGGYPLGRIIEIIGPESSGKSTVLLHAIRETQKSGNVAAYIDMEQAFDPIYASNIGINLSPDKFVFSQPDTAEQCLSIVEKLLESGEVSFIGVDSVAAMVPTAESEGEFGESKMGLHARLMSQAMRKLVAKVNKSNCVLFFTNQLRDMMGVMYGPTETTTGGNALKYYASIRLDIRRKSIDKDSEAQAISNTVRVKTIKNKTYPPFKECTFKILYGIGISHEDEIFEACVENDIIKKSGSWYSYKEKKLGQGKDNCLQVIQDLGIMDELESQVREMYGLI